MGKSFLDYSIVQFSPQPERFEYVNVGVLVFDKSREHVIQRLSSDFSRVKKFFGEANPAFLRQALEEFSQSVEFEFRRKGFRFFADEFNSKKAGIFQITPVLPVFGLNASVVLDELFSEMVDTKMATKRAKRVGSLLTDALKDAGVLPLLKKNPTAVQIKKWNVSVKADYGYQNGMYNLIDSARFDDTEKGLEIAGKQLIEGRALAETNQHRLVVVGEFGEQSEDFIGNLKEEFAQADSKLFALHEVNLLADEIRRTAH